MKHLTNLFKTLECTRAMPQAGYALSGIVQHEQSNLAEHHYLVAMIAWQLARNANAQGATLNVEKVLEYALVHDLGELFGGDIALPYWKVNPAARSLAKAFEEENRRFLTTLFGSQKDAVTQVMAEEGAHDNDESLLVKIADILSARSTNIFSGD